jgi:serralysin
VPGTFARYHAEGTSWQIYDPVANIAAAIGYAMARYGVQKDGSDLTSKVQQADPSRPPKGYEIYNEAHFCMCLTGPDPASGRRAAIDKNSKWQPGDRVSVRYLDGDPALQNRVTTVAQEWTRIANLHFDFVGDGPSDIRISFTPGNGSWSYIGTVCKTITEPQPTMNYGWLTPNSDQAEVRRVVLHEFGHAIGLIHEHVNPNGGIHWNTAAVYHDLSGPPNNWDKATIDNNMFKFYPMDAVIATPVDPISIMMYPIPKAWTTDGFSAGLNSEISDIDKSLVSSVYPK